MEGWTTRRRRLCLTPLEGRKDDLDVIVKIEPKTTSTTRVDIRVRRNPTEYDSDFEQRLLEKIRGT